MNKGTTYKRKDGRWECRIRVEDKDGHKKYRSFYGKTQEEAEYKMREETGGRITGDENITVMTVRELAWEWLYVNKNRIKDSTASNYRMKIERHILPEFGSKICASIKNKMVAEFIQKKLDQGLSARYVSDIITVMKAMYRYAANEYNITNVIEGVVLPKKAKPEINIMTAEEKRKLVYYINTNHNETTLAVALSLFTGMRINSYLPERLEMTILESKMVLRRIATVRFDIL